MFGAALARISCGVFHSLAGGFAVFCLIYICLYPHLVGMLLPHALFWGGVAAAVAYVKDYYLGG